MEPARFVVLPNDHAGSADLPDSASLLASHLLAGRSGAYDAAAPLKVAAHQEHSKATKITDSFWETGRPVTLHDVVRVPKSQGACGKYSRVAAFLGTVGTATERGRGVVADLAPRHVSVPLTNDEQWQASRALRHMVATSGARSKLCGGVLRPPDLTRGVCGL